MLTLPVPKRLHAPEQHVHWGKHVEQREFVVQDFGSCSSSLGVASPDREPPETFAPSPGSYVVIGIAPTPHSCRSKASSRASSCANSPTCSTSPASIRVGAPSYCAIYVGTPTGRTPAGSPVAPSPCGSEAFWSSLALQPIPADDDASPVDEVRPRRLAASFPCGGAAAPQVTVQSTALRAI